MTPGDFDAEVLAATFDFDAHHDDPEFRRHLREIGVPDDVDVVVALDHEPVNRVLRRIMINDFQSPCLIAIPSGDGYLFLTVEKARRHRVSFHRARLLELPDSASIGMLYASMEQCGDYVPGQWRETVRFEKLAA